MDSYPVNTINLGISSPGRYKEGILHLNKVKIMEWISVEERLPENQGLFLCCGRIIDWNMGKIPDIIFTAYFFLPGKVFDKARWCERTMVYEDVTIEYWMYLPELPQKQG